MVGQPPALQLSRRRRRGQAAVLVALSLFSLVIFAAFATNMGILVNDRIRMQNAADLGAYAAAYREAQQLNLMTQKNQDILEIARQCRKMLTQQVPIWTGEICWCQPINLQAEAIIDSCEIQIAAAVAEFMRVAEYGASVQPALRIGQQTMGRNVPGLEVETSQNKLVDDSGTSSQYGQFWTTAAQVGSLPTIANYVQDVPMFNYNVLVMCPTPGGGCAPFGVQPSQPRAIPAWFHKDDTNADIWVMAQAAGTMRSSYLDIAYSPSGNDGGYFGGSSDGGDDKMFAVGVAKPYDGSVGPTALGDGVLQAANDCVMNGVYMYTCVEEGSPVDQSMVDHYRARIAGIHEFDGSGAQVVPMDFLSREWGDVASWFHH